MRIDPTPKYNELDRGKSRVERVTRRVAIALAAASTFIFFIKLLFF